MDSKKVVKGFFAAERITCHIFFLLLIKTTIVPSNSTTSFGFDSANSCSPNSKIARRGRAQMLAAIPCDLAKQPFCHLPGSIYPWHAVRRFVHENQGLMKRMYGDVRHISILRDEIQNNEVVDEESFDDVTLRYSKMPRGAKFMLHGRESGREEYDNYKTNDVLMQPHFRPVSTTAATATTPASAEHTTPTNMPKTSTLTQASTSHRKKDQPSVNESPFSETTNTTTRPLQKDAPNTKDSNESGMLTQAKRQHTLSNTTIMTKPTIDVVGLRQELNDVMSPKASTSPTVNSTLPEPTDTSSSVSTKTYSNGSTTVAALSQRRNGTAPTGSTSAASFVSIISPTLSSLTSEKKRRPIIAKTTTAPISSTKSGFLREGQLFQDALKQEPIAVTNNMRGVNACPVKDEVVAPFWANNTRGEVLALLNLYPFEQYVHWEKCTHEFKQMFCRDGCRCEQQYRLHRLLAYDPHNECRGIFSDWFRFPSSCICKCYNIPLEFRATSRSPRFEGGFNTPRSVSNQDPIDAAETEVQRAIYEHATDQWYRRREDFDLFEG